MKTKKLDAQVDACKDNIGESIETLSAIRNMAKFKNQI